MSEKRLLIVDDEPEFGEFVRRVAIGLGYEVWVTTHGRTFQDAYHEIHPTHIVMDMVMPEIDQGFEGEPTPDRLSAFLPEAPS